MADIAMCAREGCPLASTCYRKLAKPNPLRQSYAEFTFTVHGVIPKRAVSCEAHLPTVAPPKHKEHTCPLA
jgi:hypothetical protein